MHGVPSPSIRKARKVTGRSLVFRDASPGDAEFILSLRTDEEKSRFLSRTSADVGAQRQWLERYAQAADQAYFMIESASGEQMGTIRLYDPRGSSFCWGSWILKPGAPASAAMESALMVYSYALDGLGFTASHFDVRRGNERVWQFHERFGAARVSETELDYFYEISEAVIRASCAKFRKFLPGPVRIEWP